MSATFSGRAAEIGAEADPEGRRRDSRPDADELALDRDAVAQAQAGQGEAFGQIYDRHGPRLYRNVLFPGTGGDAPAAQDLLHETFFSALEALPTFTCSPRGIYPWLRAIAANKLRDHWRRAGQAARGAKLLETLVIEPAGAATDPVEEAERQERVRDRVKRTLSALNPRYRSALEARFLDGRAAAECAQRLGVKRATFDVILHRACKAFRALFAPEMEEP